MITSISCCPSGVLFAQPHSRHMNLREPAGLDLQSDGGRVWDDKGWSELKAA